MSLFPPYVGIVTRATRSGRSPVDELYFKWLIAAAVFLVALQIAFLALFVTATFLFTPYILNCDLNYDMVMFGFVVTLLRDRPDNTMRDHWLLLAVWRLPVTMMFAGAIWIPLAPIVLIMFACWLLRRLAQNDSREVDACRCLGCDALVAGVFL
jgi:hypothetical protein